MQEYWDLYDENRIPLNRTIRRGDRLARGDHHLVIHVCVFDRQGRLLIQQRAPEKAICPGYWDVSVGGGVLAGETSQQAAARETLEELGLAIDLEGVRPQFTFNFEGGFDDFYLVECDVDPSKLMLQKGEVSDARLVTEEELADLLASGQFLPYADGFFRLCFALMKQSGNLFPEEL